ncbi:hypothetical protein HPP92_020031 [Vanilla planifolia]|uniref:RING-type domain-containing protein n=1 Tax=Vanilla planifolia TaxID=51239 RepID=A0A835Q9X9_VANPL|nr:hypothetical protein HPP92_020031 [Vanilla planifolia]
MYIYRSSAGAWRVTHENRESLHKNARIVLVLFLSLTFLIILVVTIRLFSRFINRRFCHRGGVGRGPSADSQSAGIDDCVLAAMPIFVYRRYAEVTDEVCAVCLSEPKEGEVMRMLPECRHAFHVLCIDRWLRSSRTCPVCRADVGRRRAGMGDRLLAAPPMPERLSRRGEAWGGRQAQVHGEMDLETGQ